MTVQKPNPSALTRTLALLIAAGALAGCDYASKLPDAPETLGYELQQQKPPSVTGINSSGGALVEAPIVTPPKPVDTQELHSVPLPPAPRAPDVQVTSVPQYQPEAAPRPVFEAPSVTVPAPGPQLQQVFSGPAPIVGSGEPFETAQFDPPQLGVTSQYADSYSAPAPVAFDTPTTYENVQSVENYQVGGYQVEVIETGPTIAEYSDSSTYDSGSYQTVGALDQVVTGGTSVSGSELYAPPSLGGIDVGGGYVVAAAPQATVPQRVVPEYAVPPLATPLPSETPPPIYRGTGSAAGAVNASPIQVISTRLSNGAVVNVHPVIGVPSNVSRSLANVIAREIGSPVPSVAAKGASVAFDLRAQAPGGGTAEWKLYNAGRNVIGVFSENAPAIGWRNAGEQEVSAIGRRIADRLRRNAELRRATLNAVAAAPAPRVTTGQIRVGNGQFPYPMRNPRRVGGGSVQISAPTLISPPTRARPAPVTTAALAPLAPLTQTQTISEPRVVTQVPRLRPTPPVRVAPTPPATLPGLTTAPVPQVTQAALVPETTTAPPPSFDTLRATPTEPAGPRMVVFRGVRGAPGDGDQALAREMSRVLAQSSARLSSSDSPGAVYLVAEVSTQRGGAADRVKITWQVQDAQGNKVGQVVQENDVPRGALDGGWGEDAYFATQGAKQGIMELLQEAGALG